MSNSAHLLCARKIQTVKSVSIARNTALIVSNSAHLLCARKIQTVKSVSIFTHSVKFGTFVVCTKNPKSVSISLNTALIVSNSAHLLCARKNPKVNEKSNFSEKSSKFTAHLSVHEKKSSSNVIRCYSDSVTQHLFKVIRD